MSSASHSVAGDAVACSGPCGDCGREHALYEGSARAHALELMQEFAAIQRLDYRAPADDTDPRLSFENLFADGHGNMFGVLECVDARGRTRVLRAFSSLRRGIRDVEGWVPPILSAETFYDLVLPEQREIEQLTVEMARLDPASDAHRTRAGQRRRRSQTLLEEMQRRYRFHNFRGRSRSLHDAFLGSGGIPGGVGECCAPKLLNHAAQCGLRPVGLAEFYWGGPRGSRRKQQGDFYPSCERRCRPILGFMLCGLDDAA